MKSIVVKFPKIDWREVIQTGIVAIPFALAWGIGSIHGFILLVRGALIAGYKEGRRSVLND
jgi:hypothetical protein